MTKFLVRLKTPMELETVVGVEANTVEQAVDKAAEAIKSGRLRDNRPEMPLLKDDYECVSPDQDLVFQAIRVKKFPGKSKQAEVGETNNAMRLLSTHLLMVYQEFSSKELNIPLERFEECLETVNDAFPGALPGTKPKQKKSGLHVVKSQIILATN